MIIDATQNIFKMFSILFTRIRVYFLKKGGPFLLFTVIVIAIYWAPGFFEKGFFNWGDTVFPFVPKQAIKPYYYLWNYYTGTGTPMFWVAKLPYNFLIIVLHQIGLPLWVVNRSIFLIPFIFVAWATYFLAGSMIRGRYARLACTFAGLFAILNPTVLTDVKWTFSFIGIPLTLGLFIRILRDKDNRIKYSLLLPLASLLLPIGDPIFVVLPAIVAIIYLVLHLVLEGGFRDRSLWGSLVLTLILAFLVNTYCTLPYFALSRSHDILGLKSSLPGQGWGLLTSVGFSSAGLPWIMRLITAAPNQTLKYFRIPVILLISFLLPIYVYLPLLKSKKNKSIFNLAIISLILTLFATTVRYNWFAIVYKWLWDHIYFFPIFRSPVNFQYMLSFIYAVLLGFALQMSLQINRKKLKIILVTGLTSVLFVYGSFNLGLLGREYQSFQNHLPTTVIPDSYYNLREYLLKDADWQDRLYVLPWMEWSTKYKWYTPFDMADVVLGFSPIPVIGIQSHGPSHQIEGQVIKSMTEGKVGKATKALSQLSVKYIFLHKDISEESSELVTKYLPLLPGYERLLSRNTKLFKKVLSTSEYDLYEFILPMRYPMIFAVDSSLVKYNADAEYYVFDRRPVDKLIESSFKMVNSATYTGKLKINSDAVLIFNQNFNSNWHLFINGRKVGEHIRINEFANGWFIRDRGDFKVKLKYQPQVVVLPGLIISLGTICLVLSGVGYLHFRKNRKSGKK